MIKFNRAELRDKIYACWLGKNIGGTIGAPYEGLKQMNDIQGFVTKPGEILPNDDLDLQLIWLRAMEERGPEGVNAQVLGEYWLSFEGPNWNEYGVCKSNLQAGIPAPICGELNNEYWKHSNGAWIRTEVWACLYPGNVEKAIEYAFYDACVDHGYGEGSYAAIFVAALESAAFLFKDIDVLIDIGLSKIPEDCRVARSVRMARQAYRDGKTWQEARNELLKDSEDLGWFQSPANLGYAIVGLLYGEGDFKKSLILAVNCGDDTDCTAATVGSILGIMNGTAGLPQDWVEHLGTAIVTKCIIQGYGAFPDSIDALTDAIMNYIPVTLQIPFNKTFKDARWEAIVWDEPSDFEGRKPEAYYGTDFVDTHFNCSPYTLYTASTFLEAQIEFDRSPEIAPMGTLTGKITVRPKGCPGHFHAGLNWYLPEGWTVDGKRNLHVHLFNQYKTPCNVVNFSIQAGETVAPSNHVVLEIQQTGRSESAFFAFNILG